MKHKLRKFSTIFRDRNFHTLYAHRPVLNGREILDYFRKWGFDHLEKESELHVTVALSRTPVDWRAIRPKQDEIIVPVTNLLSKEPERSVKPLGDKGAWVQTFRSDELHQRWIELRALGCSWDFATYVPHVTISYVGPRNGVSLPIHSWPGEIVLGSEVFSEVRE